MCIYLEDQIWPLKRTSNNLKGVTRVKRGKCVLWTVQLAPNNCTDFYD